MTKILDGKKLAHSIENYLKDKVQVLAQKGIVPHLAIIFVGQDLASKIYINKKIEAGERIGVKVNVYEFSGEDSNDLVIDKIKELGSDKHIHGIIVQLPLPKGFDKQRIIESIDPEKDVDGVHPLNWGKLAYENHGFIPCTPAAIMEMLQSYGIEIRGKEVVIIGKSEIVGKPLAILLMNEDATLTIVHKETRNFEDHIKKADILISATGVPSLIKQGMIKDGAVLIDVGITRVGNKVVGDFDYEKLKETAGAITPVPGGIGPVTVSMLLKNVVQFAQKQANL